MLRIAAYRAEAVRKLLQNLPAGGAIIDASNTAWLRPPHLSTRMKRFAFVLAWLITAGAAAQAPLPPTSGPGPAETASPSPAGTRGDLWQMLTPQQREQLWRSLTPEQRSDIWRGLQPQEQREMRERLGPGEMRGGGNPWAGRRSLDAGNWSHGKSMTPEERQQMREQVREAHRMRRERMEAERQRRQK
jgi:Spy/CpxP family protein refolding chaperone